MPPEPMESGASNSEQAGGTNPEAAGSTATVQQTAEDTIQEGEAEIRSVSAEIDRINAALDDLEKKNSDIYSELKEILASARAERQALEAIKRTASNELWNLSPPVSSFLRYGGEGQDISGVIILVIGVWLAASDSAAERLTQLTKTESLESTVVRQAAWVMVAAGVIVFFLAFLGCCGAIKESRFLLILYALFLVIILIVEVVAGSLALAFRAKTEEKLMDILENTINRYYTEPNPTEPHPLYHDWDLVMRQYALFLVIILIVEVVAGSLALAFRAKTEEKLMDILENTINRYYTEPNPTEPHPLYHDWDLVMRQFKCCGVNNHTDFEKVPSWPEGQIPEACCRRVEGSSAEEDEASALLDPNCPTNPSDENSYWKTGCYDKMIDWLRNHVDLVSWIVVALGLLQSLGILLSCCLIRAINRDNKGYH
ncbi:unnamed protein product [Cyprideis torosa]|uniref:Uncharacterized protein n=1 Tax=Cyprideis torosa TaxID=163714 RepID=A0A7R8ZMP9_9CRUS|nr:unnamed protein product [Cyprideis torosa]CAG0889538.1 unnamed protein product [Cyprideis torosa]